MGSHSSHSSFIRMCKFHKCKVSRYLWPLKRLLPVNPFILSGQLSCCLSSFRTTCDGCSQLLPTTQFRYVCLPLLVFLFLLECPLLPFFLGAPPCAYRETIMHRWTEGNGDLEHAVTDRSSNPNCMLLGGTSLGQCMKHVGLDLTCQQQQALVSQGYYLVQA
jgi:hypothetical protein